MNISRSASQVGIWGTCTAQPEYVLEIGATPSRNLDPAIEGHRIHELAELILLEKNIDINNIDSYARFKLRKYIDYCNNLKIDCDYYRVEDRFNGEIGNMAVDFYSVKGDKLTVVDLKTGRIKVTDDKQLVIYAYEIIKEKEQIYNINLSIVQMDEITSTTYTRKQIEDMYKEIYRKIKEPLIFKAGIHCIYCPAVGRCKVNSDYINDKYNNSIKDPVKNFKDLKAISKNITSIESKINDDLMGGVEYEGLELAAGATRLVWIDDVDKVKEVFKDLNIQHSLSISETPKEILNNNNFIEFDDIKHIIEVKQNRSSVRVKK